MNQKEIMLLMSYVLNNRTRLETELERRQSNIRLRDFTLTDCVECAYSSVYLEVEQSQFLFCAFPLLRRLPQHPHISKDVNGFNTGFPLAFLFVLITVLA